MCTMRDTNRAYESCAARMKHDGELKCDRGHGNLRGNVGITIPLRKTFFLWQPRNLRLDGFLNPSLNPAEREKRKHGWADSRFDTLIASHTPLRPTPQYGFQVPLTIYSSHYV